MHTRDEIGISPNLVNNLETIFTWTPPFSLTTPEDNDNDDIFAQPEDVTLDELDEAFDGFDKQLQIEKEHQLMADINRGEVLEGEVYDFAERKKIDREEMPASTTEEMDVIGSSGEHEWEVDTMMLTEGM
jgi:hypothetical protein